MEAPLLRSMPILAVPLSRKRRFGADPARAVIEQRSDAAMAMAMAMVLKIMQVVGGRDLRLTDVHGKVWSELLG